jgi:hypothetical protein
MSLYSSIILKQRQIPYIFSGTSVITPHERRFFPYNHYWHGDYTRDYPIIDKRTAGYYPRSNVLRLKSDIIRYRFPDGCFETAPSTQFPCY